MKLYITLLFCVFTFNVNALTKAVTEEGDIVILNNDGTWQYEGEPSSKEMEAIVNPTIFTKDPASNFTLKSTKTNTSFAINPKKWIFKKNENDHEPAEYKLRLKESDLYGLIISEQLEISIEELDNIALTNARNAAPDAKIVKKEYRTVNGNRVLYMEMVGTIQSIKFKYLGYYYADASGTTQFIVYTGVNLVEKYQTEIDNLLNGLMITK